MAKTNFEYLKDICVGNDEALEFIEAAENDFYDIKGKLEESENEAEKWEEKYNDKDGEFKNSIDVGIGHIEWNADNLQLQLLMEALGDKIKSVGPLKVLRLLEVRKPVLNR